MLFEMWLAFAQYDVRRF